MKRTAIVILALSAALLAFLLFTRLPIGIAGDWQWQRIPDNDLLWLNLAVVTAGFVLLALLALAGIKKARKFGERIVIAVLLLCLGCWFDYNLLSNGIIGCYEGVFAISEHFSTGYLEEATKIQSALDYARTFHDQIALDAHRTNHLDVHPIGNTMFAYAVLRATANGHFPRAVTEMFLTKEQIESGRGSWIQTYLLDARTPRPDYPHQAMLEAAENILVTMLVMALAAKFVILAAFLVLVRGQAENLCAIGALLATGLYCPILFLGHYDPMLYFIGAVVALLAALSYRHDSGKFAPWAAVTGICLACACMFSLAFLAMGLAVALAMVLRCGWRKCAPQFAWLGGGGIAVFAALHLCGIHAVEMCFYAWRNNARFFAESHRSVLGWPAFNALDLVMFECPAIVVTLAAAVRSAFPYRRKLRGGLWRKPSLKPLDAAGAWVASTIAVVVLLLFSGFSRGEMGRLFLFILPFLAIGACVRWSREKWSAADTALWLGAAWLSALLATTLRTCLALVFIF